MEEKKTTKKKSGALWNTYGKPATIAFLNGAVAALGAIVVTRLTGGGADQATTGFSKVTPINKVG